MSTEEIKYEQAKKEKKLRQEFLNQFFKKNKNKAVSRLIYDESGKHIREFLDNRLKNEEMSKENYEELLESLKSHDNDSLDMLAFCPRGNMGTGKSSPIFVMPACFNLFFDNFKSALVFHEYIHAEHVKYGIKFKEGLEYNYIVAQSFNPETLLELDESIAYSTTIKNAIRNRDSEFIAGCIEMLKKITKELEKKKKFTSVSEEAAVKNQIENNKKCW